MPKIKDEVRDNRIEDEVIVDAYGEYEQATSWEIYFQDGLEFPIPATVELRLRNKKTEKITVEIVEVKPNCDDSYELQLGVVEQGSQRVQYIEPNQITDMKTSLDNLQVINDWLYWHNFDLLPEDDSHYDDDDDDDEIL